MFTGSQCLFGQCGAAQSHLRNMGVGTGDVFLFFGLFADEHSGGYLRVEDMISPSTGEIGELDRPHPHTLGAWNENNTIYRGAGAVASKDHETLRLTQPGDPLRHWIVPDWLRAAGLSFHGKPERWLADNRLEVVARGQEFVADIGNDAPARDWLDRTLETIRL